MHSLFIVKNIPTRLGRAVALLSTLAVLMTFPAMAKDPETRSAIPRTLLQDLDIWLDAETEFARHDRRPRIVIVDQSHAERLHGVADRSSGRTRGLYNPETETIYLAKPWSVTDQRDISILLHEMVHHRQSQEHYYCEQAQEWRAYQIQAQWLESQGLDNNFFWPAIVLQSSCTKRDIHP